jgi:hypothetical protein
MSTQQYNRKSILKLLVIFLSVMLLPTGCANKASEANPQATEQTYAESAASASDSTVPAAESEQPTDEITSDLTQSNIPYIVTMGGEWEYNSKSPALNCYIYTHSETIDGTSYSKSLKLRYIPNSELEAGEAHEATAEKMCSWASELFSYDFKKLDDILTIDGYETIRYLATGENMDGDPMSMILSVSFTDGGVLVLFYAPVGTGMTLDTDEAVATATAQVRQITSN